MLILLVESPGWVQERDELGLVTVPDGVNACVHTDGAQYNDDQ